MKWKWSLNKQAAEETVQPIPPQQPQPQQIQPKAEPALTPVVQNPPVPHPATPKQQGWGLPKDQNAEQLLKQPHYVKAVQTFVNRNLEEIKSSGNATEYAPQAFLQYKATPETMKFFETIARPLVEQSGVTNYDDFIQKIDPNKVQNTLQSIEQKKQEGGYIEEAFDKDEQTANQLISNQLTQLEDYGNSMLSDWIQDKAMDTDNSGEPTAVARGVSNALHNFLFNKGSGNAIKWKQFFNTHVELLPKDVKKRVPATKSVYKAINQSIYEWYQSKGDEETHPCISTLEKLMQDHDPQILKALEGAAMSEEVIQTQLSHSQDGQGDSKKSLINNMEADGGKSVYDAIDVPTLSDNSVQMGYAIVDGFLERHPDFGEKLRTATYPGEDHSMIEAISQNAKQQAKMSADEIDKTTTDLIRSATYHPFLGNTEDQDEYGERIERTKFQDFFRIFPDLLPPGIDLDDEETLKDNMDKCFQAMQSQQAQGHVDQYMGDPSKQQGEPYNYIKNYYEKYYKKFGKINTYVAGVGDIKQIARLGRLAFGTVYREFRLRQQDGSAPSKVATAARGYALLKARVREINKLLLKLANSKEPQRLTKNRFIFRNEQGQLMITEKVEGKKGNKKVQYRTVPLGDDNFYLLDQAVPSRWVDGMFDLLQGKDRMKGEIDYPQALAGKLWPEQKMQSIYTVNDKGKGTFEVVPGAKTLGPEFQKAADDYLQAHPEDPDRCHGWRLHLAKVLNERIQALSQSIGKPLSATDVAERVKKVKAMSKNSGKAGARIEGVQTIEKLLKGEPTAYDTNAFLLLAKALSTFPDEQAQPVQTGINDIFAPNWREYDRFSYDDRTALMGLLPGVLAQYGPYLVHRKREAIRRRQLEDNFADRSMWQFFMLLGSRTFKGEQEKRLAWYAHELTGGMPLTNEMTPEQFLQHLQQQEKPDIYHKKMNFRKDRMNRYVEDPKHPLGIQDQPEMNNVSAVLSDIDKKCKSGELPFGSAQEWLAHYRKNAVERWQGASQDQTADTLQARLQQGQSAFEIAKEILGKSTGPEGAEGELQNRMNTYNQWLQRTGKPQKQLDLQEYAAKLVNDTIFNHRSAHDGAVENLKKVEQLDNGPKNKKDPGYYINMQQQLNLFLPPKMKNDLYLFHQEPKPVPSKQTEIQDIANSSVPEELQQMLQNQSPVEVAKSIWKNRGLSEQQAAQQIQKKMVDYNRRTERLNKTIPKEKQRKLYQSVEEYAADYVNEVVRLETYYRQQAKERLEAIQNGTANDVDFPKFSDVAEAILKVSSELSVLWDKQRTLNKLASPLFMNVVRQVADNGVKRILDYGRTNDV